MSSKAEARRSRKDAKKATPVARTIPTFSPMNAKQALYAKGILEGDIVIALGPAGTSKTFTPMAVACNLLYDHKVSKIIMCRPAVEAEEKLGYLPGGLNEKMEPWALPLLAVVQKHYGKVELQRMVRDGIIEIVPFAYMRGRTFEDAFVILDEAQNTTYGQIKLFLTRLGENIKVVINGDVTQRDIKVTSGLHTAIKLAGRYKIPCSIIEFEEADIVRSGKCLEWVSAFRKEESGI